MSAVCVRTTWIQMGVCVCVCVRACVRACVFVCVHVVNSMTRNSHCIRVYLETYCLLLHGDTFQASVWEVSGRRSVLMSHKRRNWRSR